MLPSQTRVISIQSHTVQGYVGNKSAVFPLQLLGSDVNLINSVQFSNHTVFKSYRQDVLYKFLPGIRSFIYGAKSFANVHVLGRATDSSHQIKYSSITIEFWCGYPTFSGQVLNGQQLLDLIDGLAANELLHYNHLLTGYIGSVSFLDVVLQVVDKPRTVNPGLIYVCDSVMGDQGRLYVPPNMVLYTVKRIMSESDELEACCILHAAGPSKVALTSLNIRDELLLIGSHQKVKGQPPEQFKIVIPKIPAYFTGTGDLMTALLLGWSNIYPDTLEKASELAVSSLQALLHRTLADYKAVGFQTQLSSLEVRLVQSQDDIRNPEIKLKAERYIGRVGKSFQRQQS